jgi:predicted phage baseplate assembly protein
MSQSLDPSIRNLNDCDCCEGTSGQTPVIIYNRPGLSAIAYRVGTHGRFKQSMLARLSSSDYPELDLLNTRDDDDFSIALIDAWATVADVLTFYQERIANESYLLTATERFSLRHLGQLIGYKPRDGVAARTYVAFTLDTTKGAPAQTTIDQRVKMQSIPEPGERPQTFETMETISARATWNAMRPLAIRPQPVVTTMRRASVQGIEGRIKPGDRVLIVDSGLNKSVRVVGSVTPKPDKNVTTIEFKGSFTAVPAYVIPGESSPATGATFPTKAPLNDATIESRILSRSWDQQDLFAHAAVQGWDTDEMIATVNQLIAERESATAGGYGVYALRQRAAIFGHNAPKYSTLPYSQRNATTIQNFSTSNGSPTSATSVPAVYPTSWEGRTLKTDAANSRFLHLDAVYSGIATGSYVVLEDTSGDTEVFTVSENNEITRSEFTITGKISRLKLQGSNADVEAKLQNFTLRETTVYGQSELLPLATIVLEPKTLPSNDITLDRMYGYLQPGQEVIVSGLSADSSGVTISEVATIHKVSTAGGYTRLTFESSLIHQFERDGVTINANVVLATHGETKTEVLGSGDANVPFQKFTLRQSPLTFTRGESESGVESSLEVRVNDILWHEVPTLYGCGANERVYVTSIDDEGRTTVMFGDGLTGQRLPTGVENVRATYRVGLGTEGLLKKDQLSLLITRPHGVKGVTNPLAPTDAADPESADSIRLNAPVGMRTLGYVVSLQDYEDYARAFTGIEKALASWTWNGQQRGIFVTVAGQDGREVDDETIETLVASMRAVGDPYVPLLVKTYEALYFKVKFNIAVAPDFISDKVKEAVRERLRQAFSFASRQFGQSVTVSEIVSVIQPVEGVVAVDVDALYFTGETEAYHERLTAAVPRPGENIASVTAAALLTLDSGTIDIGEMAS